MKIDILTLFPNSFEPLKESIIGRAQENGKVEINLIDIREFSLDKHKKCDDYIFGGGDGLLMTPQPLFDALDSVVTEDSYVIYFSPKGTTLTQPKVKELSNTQHLVLICGHYEGIDQRVIDKYVNEEISIGDYVLTGGELPAMVLVDAVCRYLPEVLGNSHSTEDESFSNNLLEYPQYTRPQEFRGLTVPEVLLSGNHQEIAKWRYEQSLKITKERRPDLLKDND
ncbi:MAG: tRNA (guanosine(37)-N1)-methyltransferase TrmD [Clostridia bacterium]|nr:tRNA (guanosine(37)-N1)-methyltransferase TrmD [Clostridia bacterium]